MINHSKKTGHGPICINAVSRSSPDIPLKQKQVEKYKFENYVYGVN